MKRAVGFSKAKVPPESLQAESQGPPTPKIFNATAYHQMHGSQGFDPFGNSSWVLGANGTMTKSKTVPVSHAKIFTKEDRAKCPRVFIQMCIFNTRAIDTGVPMAVANRGVVPSKNYAWVMPPTEFGRRFLTGFDHGNKGVDAANDLQDSIRFRWMADTTFPQSVCPTEDWDNLLTPDFVQRVYSVSTWRMDTSRAAPSLAAKKLSLLNFLPLVDSTYSAEYLPVTGVPWTHMVTWIRFIYYVYSAPFCPEKYDTSEFDATEFGTALRLMCRLLHNGKVMHLWNTCQQACTLKFIRDVSELFETMGMAIQHLSGAYGTGCGITVAMLHNDNEKYMVAPMTLRTDVITQAEENMIERLREYRKRMLGDWNKGRFDEYDFKWHQASGSPLFQKPTNLLDHPPLTRAPSPPTTHEEHQLKGRNKKSKGGPPAPFTSTNPLFKYVGSAVMATGAQLCRLVTSEVKRGEFPFGIPVRHVCGRTGW
mmetsp:Transcript_16250/g.39683  ORF Transcript_16250/g.39683 Transcript_16250/m.39683 type:complete len:480 (+) Transcript_16250:63-1502(+)